MYSWPLNINNFTFLDRLKIVLFFLNRRNKWTYDKYVYEFERRMADFVGSRFAVFCSSGSTANTILAYYAKDNLCSNGKSEIIFPSTTWSTSCTPFIREGFKPVFIDVDLKNFCINLDLVENYLSKNHDKVALLFITSLLGFAPDVKRLQELSTKFGVKIYLDNCEANLSKDQNGANISSQFTSSTSTYFGHMIQSVEGGFVFTNDLYEYQQFLMYRNHGLTRSLLNPEAQKLGNPLVDARFDFYLMGNNFRNTDINAFIGLLDLDRVDVYIEKRILLFKTFYELLSSGSYIKDFEIREGVPFCLPIISKNKRIKNEALEVCKSLGVETRPIISGNLLRQTAFSKYGNYQSFINSDFLNENGFYIGLYSKVDKAHLQKLVQSLNGIS